MKSNIPGGVDQNLIRWLVAWLRRREWQMPEAEARDVVGSVLVKYVEEPPEEMRSLKAFFCWKIRNEVKDRYRLRRERERLEALSMDAGFSQHATEIDYENQYALARIIDKLPARERYVFLQSCVHEVALTEIAKDMNVSFTTVWRLRKQALTRCHALAGRTHGDPK
ncbi:sigma-70 family RNA polymerase sigma factor [Peristeroidobacter soli]|jgi:RNA polymerase sigma factor (sigma-70 family)|uniref:sigma-70 family RNA polymerase sigma factor n=1 Tax=Peristeroidobacter soli TaxID=2497877 RepID=UPI00101BED08|nr:sigma-70 family RNA polymerase sigma factor [Peristeroidobacter soli]